MKKITILLLCLNYITVFGGGPWVPGNKKLYIQAGYSGLFYNEVTVGSVKTPTGKMNADVTYQLYSELGLGERGLIKLILPYKQMSSTALENKVPTTPIGSLSGLGNITFGGKYLLVDKSTKVSFGVDVQTATTKKNDVLGLRTGYEATTILPYVSVGQGFKRAYLSADLGYGVMSNQYSSFLKLNAELGFKVTKKLYSIITIDVRNPMKDGKFGVGNPAEKNYIANAAYINDQLFYGIGLKLNYELKENKFGINLSALGAIKAENVVMTPSLNGGLYFKL